MENSLSGPKYGQDLENWATHLHHESQEYSPGDSSSIAFSKIEFVYSSSFIRGGHSLIWPIRVCAAEQGMVSKVLSLES